MKIIENKILPLGRHDAINLFGLLFVKDRNIVSPALLNHEKIHSQQMRELLWVFFYMLYVVEWCVRLVQHRGKGDAAYHAISFEREAYGNDHNPCYLQHRRRFAMWRTNSRAQ
jgi:hypothetical protein